MAIDVKKICRLCANKDHVLKDLSEENNKNILKIIQEFIQITISEDDTLPTKICLNCEEKMISFQLFVLECYKVQENLQNMCAREDEKLELKLNDDLNYRITEIKSEVKVEMDEIVATLNNEATYSDVDDDNIDYDNDNNECDSDSSDGVTLASLKETKVKQASCIKPREMTDRDREELEKLLKDPRAKLKNFVKMSCAECPKRVHSWESLRSHYYTVHQKKVYTFCICGFVLTSKSAIYRHVAEHKSRPRRGSRKSSNRNSIKVTDLIRFNCEECNLDFSSWYKLNTHCMWKHKATPIVHCSCGISLNSRTVMYKHIQDHKSPDALHCDQCPKTAKTMEELQRHKLRHIPKSERTFPCSSCDKVFTSKDLVKSHERSHVPIEQRKIYECDVCNEKFTTRSSAVSHKRIVHEKIKSYVCDQCGYACGTNGELRQHRAIHSDDKPYTCRKCSKAFKTYSNLKTHMDTHEETSYVCFVCSRVLNSRRTLRKHLLVHDEKCSHVCNYCNKAFKRRQTLKVHLAMHTGDKPLSCKWCDERFAYASTLRSHRLRAHPDKMTVQMNDCYSVQQVSQDYHKTDATTLNVPKSDLQ
ncbi:zinc finger protein 708-like [Pieris brassicae]|uniref:Uncharacterized protein n=1 Tax=Pieris brassicae TaxID=7116 RepID=A0A9P0TIB4_PIEBR|nr:zinc finger protein 708-like [Pieris brassicae]CAH4031124.1 unnamed protein product [Pieris brassicae]